MRRRPWAMLAVPVLALAAASPAAATVSTGHSGWSWADPSPQGEDLADQELACALFESCDDPENLKYALAHRDIVARFGRFPHRNEVLGRACSDDELEYLKDAERFGQ